MRVIVTGSRDWGDWKLIWKTLDEVRGDYEGPFVVVHGDCITGADLRAKDWVYNTRKAYLNVTEEPHPADWSMGRQAGHWRNAHMANLGADLCLAFMNRCRKVNCPHPGVHGTHGTANMIAEAKSHDIETWIYPSYLGEE